VIVTKKVPIIDERCGNLVANTADCHVYKATDGHSLFYTNKTNHVLYALWGMYILHMAHLLRTLTQKAAYDVLGSGDAKTVHRPGVCVVVDSYTCTEHSASHYVHIPTVPV
jgi:hypothetical protein